MSVIFWIVWQPQVLVLVVHDELWVVHMSPQCDTMILRQLLRQELGFGIQRCSVWMPIVISWWVDGLWHKLSGNADVMSKLWWWRWQNPMWLVFGHWDASGVNFWCHLFRMFWGKSCLKEDHPMRQHNGRRRRREDSRSANQTEHWDCWWLHQPFQGVFRSFWGVIWKKRQTGSSIHALSAHAIMQHATCNVWLIACWAIISLFHATALSPISCSCSPLQVRPGSTPPTNPPSMTTPSSLPTPKGALVQLLLTVLRHQPHPTWTPHRPP